VFKASVQLGPLKLWKQVSQKANLLTSLAESD